MDRDDSDYPERWRRIKTGFSRALAERRKGGRSIWQRGYWEHTIRDDRDYSARMDYIHFNPVKHGFVADPANWPFRRSAAASRPACTPHSGSAAAPNPPKPAKEICGAGEAERKPPSSKRQQRCRFRYAPPALRLLDVTNATCAAELHGIGPPRRERHRHDRFVSNLSRASAAILRAPHLRRAT